jgi:malate permease and related proteins
MEIAVKILPVFLVIFLGAGAKKLGFYPDVFIKGANHLVFYIAIPALLFTKLSHTSFSETFDLGLALLSCLSIFFVWLLSIFFSILGIVSHVGRELSGSFVQTAIHGNIGYIGLAIVFYTLGNDGLKIASFLAPFIMISQNILSILSYNIFYKGHKNLFKTILHILQGVTVNPIIISAFIGILFSFFNLKLPGFIHNSLKIVSDMSLPMALLIIGASLSVSLPARHLIWLFLSSVIKLLLLPGVALFLLHKAGVPFSSMQVAVTILAVPSATVSVVMSSEMAGNVKFASSAVTLSTILFIITICFWNYVIGFMG